MTSVLPADSTHYLKSPVRQFGLAALLLMTGAAWGLRRVKVRHPFWHIALGALTAHTLVWLPAQFFRDYSLIFILPAMLAIAASRARVLHTTEKST